MLAFAPDAPTTSPEVLTAVSAIPTQRGYASPPQGVSTGASAVAANTTGGALLLKLDSSNLTLAGTAADVYSLSGGTWSSIGTGYSAGTSRWAFAIFGNTILAINKATQLQSGTSTLSTVSNAPKASTMDVVGGFVILGDCNDGSTGLTTAFGDQPHRWWINPDPTATWEPDAVTQVTSGLLVDTPGPIVKHLRLNGEVVTYKPRSLYLGRFDGSDAVLTYTTISTDVGCPARDAVVGAGSAHYFPGDDDFWMFDGSRPVSIGGPVKEWFFGSDSVTGQMNRQQASMMQALHDRRNKLIYWFYPSAGSSTLDRCIVYHYGTNRWGAFSLTVRDVLQAITSSVTIDGLDALYATIADIPEIPFDSAYWTASTPVLAYLDTSNILKSLSGSGGPMSITTGDIGDEAGVSFISQVRPKFRQKPTSGTITGSTRMALGDTYTSASSSDLNGDRFDVLQSARYHKFAMTFADQTEVEQIGARIEQEGEE
jgi:hypothetical protein